MWDLRARVRLAAVMQLLGDAPVGTTNAGERVGASLDLQGFSREDPELPSPCNWL